MTVKAECEKCGHKWGLELKPCETFTCPNCKTVYNALIVMNDPENEKAIECIRKLGSSQKEQVKRKNERV